MNFGKKVVKKAVKYSGIGLAKSALNGMKGNSDSGDARADAAGGLIRKDVKRQAGHGQISFTEETPG